MPPPPPPPSFMMPTSLTSYGYEERVFAGPSTPSNHIYTKFVISKGTELPVPNYDILVMESDDESVSNYQNQFKWSLVKTHDFNYKLRLEGSVLKAYKLMKGSQAAALVVWHVACNTTSEGSPLTSDRQLDFTSRYDITGEQHKTQHIQRIIKSEHVAPGKILAYEFEVIEQVAMSIKANSAFSILMETAWEEWYPGTQPPFVLTCTIVLMASLPIKRRTKYDLGETFMASVLSNDHSRSIESCDEWSDLDLSGDEATNIEMHELTMDE